MGKIDRIAKVGDVAEIMLDYVENKKTHQTSEVMRVPAAAYVDPEQYQREIDLIFKRLPLMLAFTIEIPDAGDFKAPPIT